MYAVYITDSCKKHTSSYKSRILGCVLRSSKKNRLLWKYANQHYFQSWVMHCLSRPIYCPIQWFVCLTLSRGAQFQIGLANQLKMQSQRKTGLYTCHNRHKKQNWVDYCVLIFLRRCCFILFKEGWHLQSDGQILRLWPERLWPPLFLWNFVLFLIILQKE